MAIKQSMLAIPLTFAFDIKIKTGRKIASLLSALYIIRHTQGTC
jgi:hypothetical protein